MSNKSISSYLKMNTSLMPILETRVGNSKYHYLYSFLYSSFANSVSPFYLKNMSQTINFLLIGLEQKKTFYIIGDKDADGVSSISILKIFLESYGCNVEYTTPLDNETYGVSTRMIEEIQTKSSDIYAVITVDTGIKEIQLAEELLQYNIPLVITDHHTPDTVLPNTPYIINPHLNPEYFLPICGAFTALKLVQALFLSQTSEYLQTVLVLFYQEKSDRLYYSPLLEHIFIPCKDSFVYNPEDSSQLLSLLQQTKSLVLTRCTLTYITQKGWIIKNKVLHIIEDMEQEYKPLFKKPKNFFRNSPTYSLLKWTQEWLQVCRYKIKEKLSQEIQIAGIATVCDRMPMNHPENRGLLKTAHQLFIQDKNYPLFHQVRGEKSLREFSTQIVPMQICPILNAGGRLGKANIVVDFLSSSSEKREERNQELLKLNKERQKKQKLGLEEVESAIILENQVHYILYASENIFKGVTGIIANKITKQYNKPAFILSIQSEQDIIVGSARSSTINIHPILTEANHLFIAFGGHQKACGFSLYKKNLPLLKQFLNEQTWNSCNEMNSHINKEIYPITLNNCSSDIFKCIELFEPYGENNIPLEFQIYIKITNPVIFGKKNQHIKWKNQDIPYAEFIFWNSAAKYSLIDLQKSIYCINFTVISNPYYQNKYQFIIQEIKEIDS